MCHSVRVFVGQFEKHWVGDVEPTCRGLGVSAGDKKKKKLMSEFLQRTLRKIRCKSLYLLR